MTDVATWIKERYGAYTNANCELLEQSINICCCLLFENKCMTRPILYLKNCLMYSQLFSWIKSCLMKSASTGLATTITFVTKIYDFVFINAMFLSANIFYNKTKFNKKKSLFVTSEHWIKFRNWKNYFHRFITSYIVQFYQVSSERLNTILSNHKCHIKRINFFRFEFLW